MLPMAVADCICSSSFAAINPFTYNYNPVISHLPLPFNSPLPKPKPKPRFTSSKFKPLCLSNPYPKAAAAATGIGETDSYLDEAPDLRKLQFNNPEVEVTELEELSENWRRSKLAWLCKELPSHKTPTIFRLLNAHKKWLRQPDATYLAVHFMRIRENSSAFSVYKWMSHQHWFRFDFALATKLADYMGRERKFAKTRELFDGIINQGRVPSESTFHILIVAYLSSPGEDCLKEACEIYNRMIHLGAYRPRLSLHNALFRAIVAQPASFAKQYLNQTEFIFHNLVTCGLEIHKDVYGGLLRLHSYQDTIDRERILSLRKEMRQQGIEESRDTLLSVMRACSKEGDVEEAERTWIKLLQCEDGMPSQAYVYRMQVHAKAGDPNKPLKIFREMQEQLEEVSVVAYQKIIEVMCEAQEAELAESLMKELIRSGLKPLAPSYLDLLNMYFKSSLHDKVESTFYECLGRCRPNRTIYSIYLDSLVHTSDIPKAETIFRQMLDNDAVGVSSRSCNTLLSGYLHGGDNGKAVKLYGFMCEKNYEVDPSLLEKLELVIRDRKKTVRKSVGLKLTPEQREILVGLLLGGLRTEYAEEKKKHYVQFEFKDSSSVHSVLKKHIYDKYHEWLQPTNYSIDYGDVTPSKFSTVPHTLFGFYADQFWADGRQSIPKLIHRWLSPRVLAYWFMYGGYRTSTGNILLKLKGRKEDVERVFKALKSKSLDFKVKQKGRVFWVGLTEGHASCFWELIEPYVLDDLLEFLESDGHPTETGAGEGTNTRSGSESDSDDSEGSDNGGASSSCNGDP